jgi:hypothetical protein
MKRRPTSCMSMWGLADEVRALVGGVRQLFLHHHKIKGMV